MLLQPKDEEEKLILSTVDQLMDKYNERYWLDKDQKREFPIDFLNDFMKLGLGSILIPVEYGGVGKGVRLASLILYNINLRGGNSYFVHGHYYNTALLSKHSGKRIIEKYFKDLANGAKVLSLALTEPQVGSDTTKIKTVAEKVGNSFFIKGHKIFISRLKYTDFMILVARTTPYEKVEKKTDGITLFLVDLREGRDGIEMREIKTMSNTNAYEVFIDGLKVPEDNVIGEVGKGFYYLLDLLNAERFMIAAEMIGNAEWFINKAVEYAKNRVVFDKQIGSFQGVQFPIAEVYAKLVSLSSYFNEGLRVIEKGKDTKTVGSYANISKYLATEIAWEAGNVAMDVYGGYGYAVETGIERKLRETRLYKVAPISQNLILAYIAHHILGLPKSY
ncbi:acyl-CoA dehydrogenase [Saccharolobus solfataricus]|uniref:Acyl-CoA dehydrogenase (Acd-7) n=3 Tax=Saccharolobus solfataricus TaxID=2287 RepID=Q97U78_SACS2|nr:acyl-CoA dehydrogenase family protein [Saccharolobus solfataricus]AAK43243.1 Acyl-CoA dehydrogenase (acd-7) [Saccharolobus solfataricus P2]AKA73271.1 acyl-CoA dehydrogenase [Saccharolobus solfataricus]AKA75970.1 acyl-CoA dehydrogenase [Saccharolobus solfataricus]AKA78663.1 acyl-CoA dehydrogenase [Saccharolobus solfataricus]AZF67738.1 acyl-CoA dehydrogenase [Saccharolobus solfataricus]